MTSARPASHTQGDVPQLIRLYGRRRWALRVLVLSVGTSVVLVLALLPFSPGTAMRLALLTPTCLSAYLLVDSLLHLLWRARTIAAWRTGELNLGVFAEGLASLPNLPKHSTQAILDTLPILPPLQDRDLSPPLRAALAALSDWRFAEETVAALLPATALGAFCAVVAIALPTGSDAWSILTVAAIATLALLMVARTCPALRHRRRLDTVLRRLPAADHAQLVDLAPKILGHRAAAGRIQALLPRLLVHRDDQARC